MKNNNLSLPRTCNFCVMDENFRSITFNNEGQCNCCIDAFGRMPFEWLSGEQGQSQLDLMLNQIKKDGIGKPYDAMIGLSGGVDSAYLAHLAVEQWGLRVLAVHVDAGWNSEPAVHNIEIMIRKLNIDLHTVVIEWAEMQDVQRSILYASVENQDLAQDHAFFSSLYRIAKKLNIKYFLSGINFATESIHSGDGFPSVDGSHIKAIHKKFGSLRLKNYPIMTICEYIWLSRIRKTISIYKPLNYINYNNLAAKEELVRLYGYKEYGKKHSESLFTKYYQEVYLPKKFGINKHRLHLSSMIVSGLISRESAIEELALHTLSSSELRRDKKFVAKKLGLKLSELEMHTNSPAKSHFDYPNQIYIISFLNKLKNWKYFLIIFYKKSRLKFFEQ